VSRRPTLALVLALVAVVPCAAAEPAGIGLPECLDYAYAHNGDLQAARTATAIQDARVQEAGGHFFPSASLDAFFTHYSAEPSTNVMAPTGPITATVDLPTGPQKVKIREVNLGALTVQTTPQDAYAFRLSLSQPIFTSGKLYNQLQLKRAERGAALTEEEKAKSDVGFAVVHAFYDLLLARQSLEANEQVSELAEAVLGGTKNRAARGSSSRLEVLQAEAEHARTTLPLVRARNERRYREDFLKHLMGWEREQPLPVRGKLAWRRFTLDAEELHRRALSDRLDLRRLDQDIAVRERELRAVLLTNTPTISLTGGYEFLQHERTDLPDEVTTGGVAMTWPFLDGLTQLPRIHEARLAVEEIRIRRQHLKGSIELEVDRAYDDFQVAEQAYLAHEKLMAAAGEQVEMSERSVGTGTVSTPELAEERVRLINARLVGAQLVFDYLMAKSELDRVTGTPPGEP
jgi:outer membrane protein